MLKIHTNLEQGHKNIITNMLCLGMYLGLLWYITKTITKLIDSINIMNLPICTGAVKPEITIDGFN